MAPDLAAIQFAKGLLLGGSRKRGIIQYPEDAVLISGVGSQDLPAKTFPILTLDPGNDPVGRHALLDEISLDGGRAFFGQGAVDRYRTFHRSPSIQIHRVGLAGTYGVQLGLVVSEISAHLGAAPFKKNTGRSFRAVRSRDGIDDADIRPAGNRQPVTHQVIPCLADPEILQAGFTVSPAGADNGDGVILPRMRAAREITKGIGPIRFINGYTVQRRVLGSMAGGQFPHQVFGPFTGDTAVHGLGAFRRSDTLHQDIGDILIGGKGGIQGIHDFSVVLIPGNNLRRIDAVTEGIRLTVLSIPGHARQE